MRTTGNKIINNTVAVPFDSNFKFAANSKTRNSKTHRPLELTLPESHVNARAHAFPVRVITVWNRLRADVILCYHLKIVTEMLI